MKISELIKELEIVLKKRGDLDVSVESEPTEYSPTPAMSIWVTEIRKPYESRRIVISAE